MISTALVLWLGATIEAADKNSLSIIDAISATLEANPTILLSRSALMASRGDFEVAAGSFDWIVDSSVDQQLIHTPITQDLTAKTDQTTVQLGVTKQFTWGMVLSPSIQLQRSNTQFPPSVTSTVGPNSTAMVNLHVAQPLLRNFGSAASAQYRATELLARAAIYDHQQVIAERVLAVATAYWRYLAAVKSLEVLDAAEKRAQQILKDARALVAADERPKADLEQLEANLADRIRARLGAEQSVFDARIALGLEMGFDLEAASVLSTPATPLPDPPLGEIALAPLDLARTALDRRQDYAGAKVRTAAMQILVAQAENTLLPQLDLVGDLGYASLVNGAGAKDFFISAPKNVPGVNAHIGLALRWPVAAIEAQGILHRATAGLRETEIARDDLRRRISLNVGSAAATLRTAARSLDRAKQAAAHYKDAVENERTKLKSGLSTIIDVILTEDRMTTARLNEIADHERYAEALASVAFELGSLTVPEGDRASVDAAHLTSLP